MAYKILIDRLARQDLVTSAEYIELHGSPDAARRWKNSLLRAIRSLDTMPYRCPMIPESEDLKLEFRQIHVSSHRVIFRVNEATKTVEVLHVYHSSRRAIQIDDLP